MIFGPRCDLSWSKFHVHLRKKVKSPVFGWNILQILIRSKWSNVSFKACVSERVNSLGTEVRGPQAAGGNKLQVKDFFFLPYTKLKEASFNSVLPWQHLVLPEFIFFSSLELTNAMLVVEMFFLSYVNETVFVLESAFLQICST